MEGEEREGKVMDGKGRVGKGTKRPGMLWAFGLPGGRAKTNVNVRSSREPG